MKRKQKIKFTTLYNTFSGNEKEEFREFISSPLINKGRNYEKILSSIKLDKSGFLEFNRSENDRTCWNRLSGLALLAEKFLVFKNMESDKFSFEMSLMKELSKRNLETFFEQKFSAAKREGINKPLSYFKLKELNELNNVHLAHSASAGNAIKFSATFYESSEYDISKLFLEFIEHLTSAWKLKISNVLHSATVQEEVFPLINFEGILEVMKKNFPKFYPIVGFNYFLYKSLIEPHKNEHYKKAKKLFENDLKNVSKEYKLGLYINLLNAATNFHNLNLPGADDELFFIMDKKLKEGLIEDIQNNNMAGNYFRDYVRTACILKKFKWAENFINKFARLLPNEHRNESVLLGKANIRFYQGNHKQCKQFLHGCMKSNPFQYVNVAILKMMVSYELDECEECHLELKRLKDYLRRPKNVQEQLFKFTKEFCSSFLLLLHLREYPTKKNFLKLEFSPSKGNVVVKKWIIEKMNQIIVP